MSSRFLALLVSILAFTVRADEIVVDDAAFTGCYHHAFEGEPVALPDGGYKAGPQAIQRTKGYLSGAGTTTSAMTLRFRLDALPAGPVRVTINGLDDRFAAVNVLRVSLNGAVVADGLTFANNANVEHGLNQRYYLGWADRALELPAAALRAGANELTIANTSSAFEAENWGFAIIDTVRFAADGPLRMTIEQPEAPIFYYGLREGIETNCWPAVSLGNRLCLLTDAPIEANFFATFPMDLPLGTAGPLRGEPTRPKRAIVLHLAASEEIAVTTVDGSPLAPEFRDGVYHYQHPIDRLIGGPTPHPSQGVRLFLRAKAPFEGATLKAWYSIDGVDYRPRDYPLRAVSLPPAAPDREQLDFLLSIWGGGVPQEPAARADYVDMLHGAGFNHLFTGNSPDLNRALKEAGFHVYPRYGWFGHQFTVTEATAQYASIDRDGKASTRDFCPLAILANADHPEIGKFFARARDLAGLSDIDGLCVDYETAAVWCWCDNCLALFREETGIEATRDELGPGGVHEHAYLDFGRRRNRDLLAKVKAIMQAVNPQLAYHALASAGDIPNYWWDGRTRGRHSIRELATFADAIYASHYCYDQPGGLKSVIPVVNSVRQYGLDSGRDVDTLLITPIATTVSEFPRYRGARLSPPMIHQMILLTAAAGGRGIALFRGDCFDGEVYLACRRATDDLLAIRPWLEARLDRSYEVDLMPTGDTGRSFHTDLAPNLISRQVWHPDRSYLYDAIQLLEGPLGNDRLLLLFNYDHQPLSARLRVRGLVEPGYDLVDHRTGASLGSYSRIQAEGGQMSVTIAPQSCALLRLVARP